MTPATVGPLHGSRTLHAAEHVPLFPSPSALHARGLTGLLVRASLAVAAWGEDRAVRRADAALVRPARRHRGAVQGWSDLDQARERYADRRAAGFLEP